MRHVHQKTYAGSALRPTMEYHLSEDGRVFIAATPWGNKDASIELQNTIKEYFLASLSDTEATSPFAPLPGLSEAGHKLRTAMLLTNDLILRKLNKDSYTSSCEALVMSFNQTELTWIQVGQPHLLLLRAGILIPLKIAMDLSFDYPNIAPLPSHLIGVDKSFEFETRSLTLRPSDKIVALARSRIPQNFFAARFENINGDNLTRALYRMASEDNKDWPFWVCVIE